MTLPIGGCNECGRAAKVTSEIGRECTRTVGCAGRIVPTNNKNDWENCPVCRGKGRLNIIQCKRCVGVGFLYAHPALPN